MVPLGTLPIPMMVGRRTLDPHFESIFGVILPNLFHPTMYGIIDLLIEVQQVDQTKSGDSWLYLNSSFTKPSRPMWFWDDQPSYLTPPEQVTFQVVCHLG